MTLEPGVRVLVDGEIRGVIERVIWCRGMATPLYLIEWWDRGQVYSREFHAADVRPLGNGADGE